MDGEARKQAESRGHGASAAIRKARELVESDDATARWIGRDTLRDLTR